MSKKVKKEGWETADLAKWIQMDLEAAISLLTLLRDNKDLFQLVVKAMEEWRLQMIENEKSIAAAKAEIDQATKDVPQMAIN